MDVKLAGTHRVPRERSKIDQKYIILSIFRHEKAIFFGNYIIPFKTDSAITATERPGNGCQDSSCRIPDPSFPESNKANLSIGGKVLL